MPKTKKLTYIFDSESVSDEIIAYRERITVDSLTRRYIDRVLSFRPRTPLAFISGAGIAGLSSAFELLAKGFKVIIAEKRSAFDRFNFINLDIEVQRFLKKFNLLNEFETKVAAKTSSHELVRYRKDEFTRLEISDVSKLQSNANLLFEPEYFEQLFTAPGAYSVKIKDLQTFLCKKAMDSGVRLLGNVEVEVLHNEQGDLAVEVKGKESISEAIKLEPCLSFIAEGAHSTTADKLGMLINEIENECTGENWIFGNVKYSGTKTFVVSVIDTSEGSLQISNIVFNSVTHEANVAVTSSNDLDLANIHARILMMAQRVFSYKGIEEQVELITSVQKPVHIKNSQRNNYSIGNAFCVGDAAGNSSPLAGMGGTLGLTLVPYAVKQLVEDREQHPEQMHVNFNTYSQAYTSRWIEKSAAIKKKSISVYKDADVSEESRKLQCK